MTPSDDASYAARWSIPSRHQSLAAAGAGPTGPESSAYPASSMEDNKYTAYDNEENGKPLINDRMGDYESASVHRCAESKLLNALCFHSNMATHTCIAKCICYMLSAYALYTLFASTSIDADTREKATTRCAAPDRVDRCSNPYNQRGVLLVNSTFASGNRWEPIDQSCPHPRDWVGLVAARSEERGLDFLKGKTIALFGDSIDRTHIVDMCTFMQGSLQIITPSHPLSPPYPVGQELPPTGFQNAIDHTQTWPIFDQSRPYVCNIHPYNFKIISFFHYGHQEDLNHEMRYLPHYYPPHRVEDRFEHIVLPLLTSLGSPIPDVFSFSAGFWTLFRFAQVDQTAWNEMMQEGGEYNSTLQALEDWNDLSQQRRRMLETRMKVSLQSIARAWKSDSGKRPRILFRELHHPKAQGTIPFNRVQAVNSISLAVVESLILEDCMLLSEESEDLFDRLVVDHWGSLILGQEHHSIDNVHPKALPASYLYGNMLLEQLYRSVES